MPDKIFQLTRILILFSGLVLALFYATNNILTIDHLSMISRGYLAGVKGIWIPYGNPSSGIAGNTPGYLSSFVVGFPYLLWQSNYAPIVFLLVLQLSSYLLLDSVIKHSFKDNTYRLAFVIIYWLNPWLLHEIVIWNPAYLFFFSAVHIKTAQLMHEKKSFVATMLHVLSVGLAGQLHFSAVVLMIASIGMFLKNHIKVNWWGLLFAVAMIFVSLVPFALSAIDNPQLIFKEGQADQSYFGRGGLLVYPVLKAITYWFRYGSMMFTHQIVSYAQFLWVGGPDWVQNFAVYSWRTVLYGIGLISISISVWANINCFKIIYPKPIKGRTQRALTTETTAISWLVHYVYYTFVALVLCAIVSPVTLVSWHLIVTFQAALIPILVLLKKWMDGDAANRTKQLKLGLGIIVMYLIFVNLVASHDSRRFSYNASYDAQVSTYIQKL